MRILEKHILRSFIVSFVFCITLLMVLGVIGDILGFLDDIFKNGISLVNIIMFYLYFAPFAFVNMVPFACLLSSVFVFNTLSKNHEVSAMITSGVSLWVPMRPILFVTFIICLATFIINEKIVPVTIRRADEIKHEKLETESGGKKISISNIALYGKGDQIIFAREYYPSERKLVDVIIQKQNSDQAVVQKINVRTAVWRKEGYWLGKDVLVFKSNDDGEFVMEPEFYISRKLPIKEKPTDFLNTEWDPKLMNYGKLDGYIKVISGSSPATVKRLKVDLQYKLSFPFTSMITVLVGIPFSISTGRVNALLGMARGITAAMLYVPIMAISLAFGKAGVINPVLSAWLSILVFTSLGVVAVNKRS